MFKNHSIYKRLIFLVLMVVLSCANIGFSSFQYIADNDSTNVADDFAENNNNLKQLTVTPLTTNQTIQKEYFDTNGSITLTRIEFDVNNASVIDQLTSIINTYKATNDSTFDIFINFDQDEANNPIITKSNQISIGTYSMNSNIENKKLKIEVINTLTFKSEMNRQQKITNTYNGKLVIYLQTSDFTYVPRDNILINYTSEISLSEIEHTCMNLFNKTNTSQSYAFIGFYEDFQNGLPINQLSIDTITDTRIIYAAFYESQELEIDERISVTKTINNATTGNLNFYLNSSIENNIGIDYSYNEITNSFNLGFTNQATTIASGTTVDFALNDGYKHSLENYGNPENNPSYANPDTDINAKQYTIKLINDLYINGTLNIHAQIGSNMSTSMQSSINGRYVNLDLNGHNICISSTGKLNSYGIIQDTVGTGQINVLAGGQLTSYVTIEDYKSGNSTTALVNQKVFPFTNYLFPYLRCKVYIECKKDSQNNISTGIFNGIATLKLINNVNDVPLVGDVTIPLLHLTLNFIGTNDNTFFKIQNILSNNGETSGIYIDFTFNKNKDFSEFSTTSNEFQYLTTIRNKWIFKNIDINLGRIVMDIQTALKDALTATIGGLAAVAIDFILNMSGGSIPTLIYTDEYIFPLPAYFDLNFINSKFHFSQPVQILPGASLYFDENSYVYLEYNSSRSAGLYSSGESVNIFKNGTFINNRRTSTATSDLSSAPLFNTQSIWKYSNQPTINCLGTIVFTKGNNASLPYILTGAVNFNRVATCDNGGSNLQRLNVPKNQLFSTLKNNNINVKTYSYFIYPGNENMSLKSYTLPLISYDSAYIYNCDGSYYLFGNYNQDNGIFTNQDGSHYFFLNDTTFSLNNSNTAPTKLESFDSSLNYLPHNGSNYVYFGGCYWPATSLSGNTATINITKANNSSTSVNVSYNTANKLWLK